MSSSKSMSLAAKLVTAAAVCMVLSIGLCGGGLVFPHVPSRLIGYSVIVGLGFLGLTVVLALAALVTALWQGPH